jgi:hypothetical protein
LFHKKSVQPWSLNSKDIVCQALSCFQKANVCSLRAIFQLLHNGDIWYISQKLLGWLLPFGDFLSNGQFQRKATFRNRFNGKIFRSKLRMPSSHLKTLANGHFKPIQLVQTQI